MVKLTHVITDTNLGGAGRLLTTLLKNRDRSKFDVSVILPRGSVLEPEIREAGCEVTLAEKTAENSFSAGAVFELARLLRSLNPDIVHTHACMSARIAARLFTKSKIIYTRHCAYDLPAYKKQFPYKTFAGLVNNFFCDRVIAISPAAKENVVDMGGDPERIAVMFNGVDEVPRLSPEERLAVRKRLGIDETDFVCAIIARLVKVKGHEYIIEAFKALPPDIKLVIAGEGEEEQSLRALAAGMDNCIFTGFVKDIYEIENITDLQLNASYGTETSSLSLLEGMCLGLPAVVSDFGGNPYLIENGVNGLVVPKRNGQAIKEAVLELKNDRERYNKISESCEPIYRERFTSQVMAKNTEREYLRLVNVEFPPKTRVVNF